MSSNNLGRTLVAQGQGSNVFTAINDADEVLDQALTGVADVLVHDSTITVTAAEWGKASVRFYSDSPLPSGTLTALVPATQRGLVTIINNTLGEIEVGIDGQSEAMPMVDAGGFMLVSSDGDNVRVVGSTNYDIPLNYAGTPSGSEIIAAFVMVREVTFGADFAGARGYVGTPPASPFTVSIRADNVQIGTVSIGDASPATDFTFQTTGNIEQSLAVGAVLEFVAPSSADPDISFILFTLPGRT